MSPHADTTWSDPMQEAWHVFHDAQEGDEIAWNDRVQGCEVTDVGQRDDGQKYIVAVGPNGGGPYVLTEQYDDNGNPDYKTGYGSDPDNAERAVDRLAFVTRWYRSEDSPGGKHITEEEYQSLLDEAASEMLSTFESGDYRDLDVAGSDVADQTIAMRGDHVARGVLRHADDVSTDDPAYIRPDTDRAKDVLARELYQNAPDRPYAGGEGDITSEADYQMLVDAGATKVRSFGYDSDADLQEAAADVAQTIVAVLSTADLMQVAHYATGSTALIDEDETEELRQFARGALSVDIVDEVEERDTEDIRRDDGPIWQTADEYVTDLAGRELTWDDVKSAWGTTAEEAREALDDRVPVLADGGQPHTLVDEATDLYGEEVPGTFNSWRLDDPGIVTDGDARKMAWVNDDTGEILALVGLDEEWMQPADDFDKWTIFYYQPTGDELDPLHSTPEFTDAIQYCREFITGGEDADFEVVDTGSEQYVKDNIDKEEMGERLLRASGFEVFGQDIPVPTREVPKRAGEGLFDTIRMGGRAAGRAGKAAGSAAVSAGESAAGYVWENYKEEIATGVGWILLLNAARVADIATRKTRFGVNVDEAQVGFNVSFTHAPDDEDTEVLGEFNVTKDKARLLSQLGLKSRTTWALGLGQKQSDAIFERIMDSEFDLGVFTGDPDEMSEKERARQTPGEVAYENADEDEREDMEREVRDAATPDVGGSGSSSGGGSSSASSTSSSDESDSGGQDTSDGGETVSGSSSDYTGSVTTSGVGDEEEIAQAIEDLEKMRPDDYYEDDDPDDDYATEFGGRAEENDVADPRGAARATGDDDESQDTSDTDDGASEPSGPLLGPEEPPEPPEDDDDDPDREDLREAEVEAGILDEEDKEILDALDGADREEMVDDMHGDEVDFEEDLHDRPPGDEGVLEMQREQREAEWDDPMDAVPGDEEMGGGAFGGTDYDNTQYQDWEDWS